MHNRIEVIALWNAPFQAAEPSDVPVELGLPLALLEQLADKLRGGVVGLAEVGVVLGLVLPDGIIVLDLGLGCQEDPILIGQNIDVVALVQSTSWTGL